MKRLWLATLGVVACTIPARAQEAPRPGLERCDSPRGSAWCGAITVLEDHGDPDSRTIDLRVKILPGAPESTASPVFFLAGGPGQAVADLESLIVARFGNRLPDRDFVLVDQRGTGGSNPLTCETDAPNDPTRFFGPHYTEEELRACLDQLSTRADVRLYTTVDFAHDLDAVRDTLGYDRIDLVGGSYGTKAALVYMSQFTHRVRTAVLEGVASTSFLNPLPAARGSQQALDALFADCEADEACGARFPDLSAQFDRVMARLAEEPAEVSVPGSKTKVSLERGHLAYLTHILLFNTQSSALVPALIDQIDRGEYQLVTAIYQQIVDGLVEGIYFGLQLTVSCTENAPYYEMRDVEAETTGTYIGREMVDGMADQCQIWPTGELPEGFHDPVLVDTPSLLISGALDPATPVRFAEEVAEHLTNARSFMIEKGAHITPHPCTDAMVADFIESGGRGALESECLASIGRPPFQVPHSAPPPTQEGGR